MSDLKVAPLEGTIYSDHTHQPYPQRMSEIVRSRNPRVRFEPWLRSRWKIFLGPRPAAIQIQWFDVFPRRDSALRAISGALRMTGFLVLARSAGIGTLVIFHNPVGKGHNRIILDRTLRSALVAIGQSFVVLNPEALEVVSNEIAPPLRRKFLKRAFVVPHPCRIVDHGRPMRTGEARAQLAIESRQPIIVQIPGANQPLPSWSLEDSEGRYSLLRLERSDEPLVIHQTPRGFLAKGRPTDEEFGLMISAADAVVLTDPRAFGSATLHAAVDLGRPVIAPECPATRELGELGAAVLTAGVPTCDTVSEALRVLEGKDLTRAFEMFKERHRDEVVADKATKALACALRHRDCPNSGGRLSEGPWIL